MAEIYPGYNVDPRVRKVIDRCLSIGINNFRKKANTPTWFKFSTLERDLCIPSKLPMTNEEKARRMLKKGTRPTVIKRATKASPKPSQAQETESSPVMDFLKGVGTTLTALISPAAQQRQQQSPAASQRQSPAASQRQSPAASPRRQQPPTPSPRQSPAASPRRQQPPTPSPRQSPAASPRRQQPPTPSPRQSPPASQRRQQQTNA
jgi:hypothetical protein